MSYEMMREFIRATVQLEVQRATETFTRSLPAPEQKAVQGEKGEPGEQGPAGPAGPAGEKGEPGANGLGITAASVVDGELVVTLSDGSRLKAGTVVGPRGEKGEAGEPGERGGRGHQGETGAPGREGRDGRDGIDGKDGKDGIASVDEIRNEIAKAVANAVPSVVRERVAEELAQRPDFEYRGVWADGEEYRRGNWATWGGSLWHCNATGTTEKPGASDDWTLAVKKGRDAK